MRATLDIVWLATALRVVMLENSIGRNMGGVKASCEIVDPLEARLGTAAAQLARVHVRGERTRTGQAPSRASLALRDPDGIVLAIAPRRSRRLVTA